MTRIHFAGINTTPIAEAVEGRHMLMSYADTLNGHGGVIAREVIPRLAKGLYDESILDSGAFSVISKGIKISVEDYGKFALEYGYTFDTIVNLDDIAGDLEVTERNQRHLEGLGLKVMPVFHQGEPIAVWRRYLHDHVQVGLGFARHGCTCHQSPHLKGCKGGRLKYGKNVNRAWLSSVFSYVMAVERYAKRGKWGNYVHGFAMTQWIDEFPFTSVDSTSWISEYRGLCKRLDEDGNEKCPHGTWGELADVLEQMPRRLVKKLALDSYSQVGSVDPSAWAASHSKGQARTVFNRFSRRELGDWFNLNAQFIAHDCIWS